MSWRWENIDPDTLTRWDSRHAPRTSRVDPGFWRGVTIAAILSTPAWATLYVAGRAGGVW